MIYTIAVGFINPWDFSYIKSIPQFITFSERTSYHEVDSDNACQEEPCYAEEPVEVARRIGRYVLAPWMRSCSQPNG